MKKLFATFTRFFFPSGSSAATAQPERPFSAAAIIALLAFAKLALHFATAGRYGIFRDELYFIACARHLAWGYVDHPPLIALLTWVAAHVFGTSLFGLRLLPAVAGALLVWLTAQIAREFGGGRFAQAMAAFAILPVPIYLMLNHWLTMNAFEPLLWTATLWLALRLISRSEPRYWLAIGAVWGIGLENKYSMLFPATALVFALLLTPERRLLKSWWFVAGAAVAFLLFLPNLVWLARHGFPFLEFEHNSRLGRTRLVRAPLGFLADQVLIMNPALAPLWVGGLVWLMRSERARSYRFAGWMFLGIFGLLLALKAKNYYVAPAYPALFAAGAVALEEWTAKDRRWARSAYVAAVLIAGLVLAPFVLPILPVQTFIAYERALGGFQPVRFEEQASGPLPQQFADEFGWEDMTRETGRVFGGLSDADKKATAVFANDYGEAGAIDFFGPKYGLPAAIGSHETYWLWGPRDYTGKSIIVLGSDGQGDREHFLSVQAVGRGGSPLLPAGRTLRALPLPGPQGRAARVLAGDQELVGCDHANRLPRLPNAPR